MADKDDVNITVSENEIEEDDTEKQSETVEVDKRRNKASTTDCWRYFSKVGEDKNKAKCNGCNKVFACGGRKYGTSHLNRHIMKCGKIKTEDIGQMMLDMQGKLKAKKIDQSVHRQLLCELIVRHNLPYKFVEYPELRN